MKATISPLADTLVHCLKVDSPVEKSHLESLSLSEWEKLTVLAKQHHLLPLLKYRLAAENLEHLIPETILEQMNSVLLQTTMRNLSLLAEFRQLVNEFGENAIEVIALKGIYLAATVYPQIGLRHMRDIDLLVSPQDMLEAVRIMQSLGYKPEREITELDLSFKYAHHLPLFTKNKKLRVEIHARLTISSDQHGEKSQLWWKGRQTVQIAGVTAEVLAPLDLILHLCIHISYHHCFKVDLRHYYDLVAVICFWGKEFDWDELVRRTKQRKWEKGVLLTLKMVQSLFRLPLPEKLLNPLSQNIAAKTLNEMMGFAFDKLWHLHEDNNPDFSKTVAAINYKTSLWSKISYGWQRIFVSEEIMKHKYPTRADLIPICFYYPVRLKDLFVKHISTLWNMKRKNEQTMASVARKHRLQEWLNN